MMSIYFISLNSVQEKNLIITLDFTTVLCLIALHYLSEWTDQLHGYKITYALKSTYKMSYYLTLCKYRVFHLYKLKAMVFILVRDNRTTWNADFFCYIKYTEYGICKKSPPSAPIFLCGSVS